MIPLADLHCHLLAGLDDGPRTVDEALAMCRLAYEEGTRLVAALAHQSERWSKVTPEVIRQGVRQLAQNLEQAQLPLAVYPAAEVMASPDLEALWAAGQLLSVADRKRFLVVEMPRHLFVDLVPTVRHLCQAGVRVILTHPEQHPELLHDSGAWRP